jgi:hypothetical protein
MDCPIIMYRKDAIITRLRATSTSGSVIFSNKLPFSVLNVSFSIVISPLVILFDYIYACRCDKVTIFWKYFFKI